MGRRADDGVKAMQAESGESADEQRAHTSIELVGEKPPAPFEWIDGDPDKSYYLAAGISESGFDRVCADVKRKGFEKHSGNARMRGISPSAEFHQVFEISKQTAEKHNESRAKFEMERMEKVSRNQAARRRPGHQDVIRLSDGTAVAMRGRTNVRQTGGKRGSRSFSGPGGVIKK